MTKKQAKTKTKARSKTDLPVKPVPRTRKQRTRRPPALMQEQIEKPSTTVHCPQSILEEDLPKVKKHPEEYLEINMISKNRTVDNYYILSTVKKFDYRSTTYTVNEKKIFLLPSKSGFFILTCFYKEGQRDPKNFSKTNKGITSKALTLLYKEELYQDLFNPEDAKYNFFIAIFSVVNLIVYSIGLYLVFR